MDWLLENIIAIIALLIAGWTAIYSKKYSARQTQLQRRIVELEEERERQKQAQKNTADVKAEITYSPTSQGKKPHLRIYNKGEGAANSVRIFIDGKPVTQCEFIVDAEDEFEVIAPDSDVKLLMGLSKQSSSSWKVTVYWNDKSDQNKKFETTLTR